MKMNRSLIWIALLLLVVLSGAACGGGSGDPVAGAPGRSPVTSPSEEEEGGGEHEEDHSAAKGSAPGEKKRATVEIIDTAFKEPRTVVSAGTKVVWTQTGDQPHSATSVDGAFDSSPGCSPIKGDEGCLAAGDSFSFVFEKPGTYDYYCRIHGTTTGRGMIGTIVVQ